MKYWKSGLETTVCGMVPSAKVQIHPLAHQKIQALMGEFKNQEWLGYLTGKVKDGTFLVRDVVIPKQEASVASVQVLAQARTPEKLIGVIHSHHTMGSFFSGTDEEFINANHNLSIVVSVQGYKAEVRLKAPCGALVKKEAKVEIYFTPANLDEFLTEAKKNIKAQTYKWEGIQPSFFPQQDDKLTDDDTDLEIAMMIWEGIPEEEIIRTMGIGQDRVKKVFDEIMKDEIDAVR
jgi:proteasome lid subunit RPN8/RPN11